jgi:predicted P-loop ATPase
MEENQQNNAKDDPNAEPIIKLENHLKENFDFRFNEVLKQIEFREKGKQKFEILSEENRTKQKLRVHLAKKKFKSYKTYLDDLLVDPDLTKSYNPFNDYFENLPHWNKTMPNYILKLCSYIKAKDQEWFNLMFKKHLVRTVACALRKIEFNKHCFVLQSEQNDGKSSFIRFLMPKCLNDDYFKEDPQLDHKDAAISLSRNLIVNLDELHELDKIAAGKIKALFSKNQISERLSHDKFDSKLKRYASFFGTINNTDFLNDTSGNVRWLIFQVQEIFWQGENGYIANVDMDLVWSQAYHLMETGFEPELNKEEISKVNEKNRFFQKFSRENELVEKYFEPSTKEDPEALFLTANDILAGVNYVEKDNGLRINTNNIGKALEYFKYDRIQGRRKGKKTPFYGYYVKILNDRIFNFLEKYTNNVTTLLQES